MPDNLSISIGVDTSKARADLELLNAKIRELRKEVRAASSEANASGGMTPRLSAAIKELTAAEAQQKTYARAARFTAAANAEAGMSFADLGKQVGAFAKVSGVAIGGIKALRFGLVGLVAAEAIRGFTAAVDKINELSIAAKEAGTSVGTLKAVQDAFRAAGDDAGKAAPLLSTFHKAAREARLAGIETDKQASRAAADALAAGASQAEAEAAAAKVRQQASQDEFAKLGINVGLYNQTLEDQKRLMADAAAAILKKKAAGGFIDETEVATLKLFGGELAVIEPELKRIADSTLAIAEPSKVNVAIQEEYNKTVAAGVGWWETLIEAIGRAGQAVVLFNANATRFQEITGAYPVFGGFASGGYVSGPGTGTSDSILARLSDGEFVMRAAAVRRWGPRFMAALNAMRNPFGGFASGGAVRVRGVPGFAGGGLARAGGGATVNLMFPGGSFALTADNAIVGGLTREAKRAGMLAGGRRAGLLQ